MNVESQQIQNKSIQRRQC